MPGTLIQRLREGSGADRELGLSKAEILAIKAIRERNRKLVAYPYISNQVALLAAQEKQDGR